MSTMLDMAFGMNTKRRLACMIPLVTLAATPLFACSSDPASSTDLLSQADGIVTIRTVVMRPTAAIQWIPQSMNPLAAATTLAGSIKPPMNYPLCRGLFGDISVADWDKLKVAVAYMLLWSANPHPPTGFGRNAALGCGMDWQDFVASGEYRGFTMAKSMAISCINGKIADPCNSLPAGTQLAGHGGELGSYSAGFTPLPATGSPKDFLDFLKGTPFSAWNNRIKVAAEPYTFVLKTLDSDGGVQAVNRTNIIAEADIRVGDTKGRFRMFQRARVENPARAGSYMVFGYDAPYITNNLLVTINCDGTQQVELEHSVFPAVGIWVDGVQVKERLPTMPGDAKTLIESGWESYTAPGKDNGIVPTMKMTYSTTAPFTETTLGVACQKDVGVRLGSGGRGGGIGIDGLGGVGAGGGGSTGDAGSTGNDSGIGGGSGSCGFDEQYDSPAWAMPTDWSPDVDTARTCPAP